MLTYLHTSRLQEFDQYGDRLVGGKLFTFELGTTTPKISYADIYGNAAQSNPIILDSYGSADVYLLGSYTLALYDSNDVLIATTDIRENVNDSLSTSAIGTWAQNEVIAVENYSALRAINSPYAWVFVQGRETQADGGQGTFYLNIGSTSTDDDGVILDPNTTGKYIRYNV